MSAGASAGDRRAPRGRDGLVATYRLQLHPGFTLHDAAAVVPYLAELGVSHVYVSPVLQSAPGSTHGYDVVDHRRVDDELGGETGFDAFCAAASAAGLGVVLDIVPNHMATHARTNRWWWDVLRHGRSSRYADWFDIDWQPREEKLRDVVLVPVLAEQYGKALDNGDVRLVLGESGEVEVRAGSVELPCSDAAAEALVAEAGCGVAVDAGVLARLLDEINADRDRLHEVLEQQHYRLAHWRTARTELDYRRFFDVTDLIGVRVELPEVFEAVHQRALAWVREGRVQGLRVDHPDGLRDPTEYCRRLRAEAPDAWLLVEKILATDEQLPSSWPVDGTTGYEFVDLALGVFVDPAAEARLTELYRDVSGETDDAATVEATAKRLVTETLLVAEVQRVADLLASATERHLDHRDHTRDELGQVVRELVVAWPVYRTYLRPGEAPSAEDLAIVDGAVTEVCERRPDLADAVAFVRGLLLGEIDDPVAADVTGRFQQLTGAATAKGVEDTAFYRYNRLVAHNEVGGDPGRFAVSPDDLHRTLAETQRRFPLAMRTTSTHDTKRGADVRTRLAALTHLAYPWASAVARWRTQMERHREGGSPDRNLEYLLYQTLVGAWPIATDRLFPYLEKAGREAKVHTTWVDPDEAYEDAVRRFAQGALDDAALVADLDAFVGQLDAYARVVALGYDLLLLAGPGVPDLYQGTELWDRSLVDPDNRRPVDFELRRGLLAQLAVRPDDVPGPDELDALAPGASKLWLRRSLLALRRRRPAAFGPEGAYRPLRAEGRHADAAFAFGRGDDVVVVVTRSPARTTEGWDDTHLALPGGSWHEVVGGRMRDARGSVALADLLSPWPVAVLERSAG